MGFKLSIINAPAEAVLWNANFDWQSFDYDPIADSGWLSIDESWDYPSDPRGCTTLHIWALDAENNVIFDIYNLGPVDDGKSYIFDYASGMLIEVEVELKAGTITRKELDYQDRWQAIPIYDILAGIRTRVRITGRNDTDVTQRMGISWKVWDPDGVVVDEYSAWEVWPYTASGTEHEFVGGGFDLDKVGTYILEVGLYMNPDAPEMVDWYKDTICTVAVALEYAGTITRKELEYDGSRESIPVS